MTESNVSPFTSETQGILIEADSLLDLLAMMPDDLLQYEDLGQCFVYAFEVMSLVKIGRTKNPISRIKEWEMRYRSHGIATGRAFISVPHINAPYTETMLHRYFSNASVRRELFNVPIADVKNKLAREGIKAISGEEVDDIRNVNNEKSERLLEMMKSIIYNGGKCFPVNCNNHAILAEEILWALLIRNDLSEWFGEMKFEKALEYGLKCVNEAKGNPNRSMREIVSWATGMIHDEYMAYDEDEIFDKNIPEAPDQC